MDARQLKQMITGALGSVRLALRGRLQRAAGGKQVILVQAEGLAGEQFNDTEFFQHPGLRSLPLAGMQAIVIPLGGRSANGVVVAMSNGALFITDLQPGEVALFNENDGVANSIILRNGQVIDMTCATLNITASTAVNITTPALHVDAATTTTTGDVNVAKTLTATVDVKVAGKFLKDHVHDKVSAGFANTGKNQ